MKICQACHQAILSTDWCCSACGTQIEQRDGVWMFAPEVGEKNDMYASTWHDRLFRAEAGHFWFVSRNRLILWALQRYFPHTSTFLELGCGTGFVAAGIKQAHPKLTMFLGDLFVSGLRYAASRVPDATLFQLDIRHLPFEREFDVIGLFDVLEHIDDDVAVLKETYRAVKPDGGILITVPQHPSLWSPIDAVSGHKRRYRRSELAEKVCQAGFEPIFMTSFVSLLLPLMIVSRVLRRSPKKEADLMVEFDISPTLSRLLERILRIECQMIQAGCRFMAGGSLLMVAKCNNGK